MVAKEYVPKRLQVSEDLAKIIETKKGQKVIIPSPNWFLITFSTGDEGSGDKEVVGLHQGEGSEGDTSIYFFFHLY